MALFAKSLLLLIVTPPPAVDAIPPPSASPKIAVAELYAIWLAEIFSVPPRSIAMPPPQAESETTVLLITELDLMVRLPPLQQMPPPWIHNETLFATEQVTKETVPSQLLIPAPPSSWTKPF